MKISTFLLILVTVGVVFFLFASMVSEANSYYGTDINSSEWDEEYDYANTINTKITPLKTSLETIETPETGWFIKILAGIAAIPKAVTLLPTLLFSGFSIGSSMFTGFFTILGIPGYILTVVLISITIWGVIKLIEVFQRWSI